MSDGGRSMRPPPEAAVDGRLWCGDNLTILREQIPDACIDLVYLDPPFNSGRVWRLGDDVATDTAAVVPGAVAYTDVWAYDDAAAAARTRLAATAAAPKVAALAALVGEGPLLAYLLAMWERLRECRRVLAVTGSLYLHCDQQASHYLKVVCDTVFGPDCFLNEIVWTYGLGGSSARYWPRKHDTILWYAAGRGPKGAARHYFAPDMVPATSRRMAGQMKKRIDVWDDIASLNNMASERLGYPTQKPQALLERIVQSSCPPGGIVLDPYCGSGTTLAAAAASGRRWCGVDASPAAIALTAARLGASADTVP